MIFATHRMVSLAQADIVFELKKGEVAVSGSRDAMFTEPIAR